MNRLAKRVVVALLPSLVAVAAFGQNWPKPSKSQNTEVTCSVTPCTGKKTVGYMLPLSTFTGRILDSQGTNDYQQQFRTARAVMTVMSPDGRRLYMLIGSMAGAYDTASFFTRLSSGEALMPATAIPLSVASTRPGSPEVFLRPDRFFYAENGGGWSTPYVDGQSRLNDIDVDDQGYVYLSYYVFGWGIVKDDLVTDGNVGAMQSVYQHLGDADATNIMSFKNGNQYYVLVNVGTTQVWNVTDRTNPIQVVSSLSTRFSQGAKNAAGDRIALIDSATGKVNIYSASSLAVGGLPSASFSVPFPYQYDQIASDGTNFFATYKTGNLKIDTFVPSGSTFTRTEFDTGYAVYAGPMTASSGYLLVNSTSGLIVYKVGQNLDFTEVPMASSYAAAQRQTGLAAGYFQQYYFSPPTAAYMAPPFYVHPSQATIVKSGTKSYMVFLAYGLADAYELQTADGITVTSSGSVGTVNVSTPPAQRTQTFYGDPIGFTATTTAPNPMTINWNFGNPEAVAGADLNIAPPPTAAGQTGPGIVTHRYSGISTAAGLTPPRTVTVTNALDGSIFGQTTVSMQAPSARIGLTALSSSSLFTTTTATSNAPVVPGDKFYDASDGSVDGHASVWMLYNAAGPTGQPATTTLTPAQQQDVGQCGPHYMSFTGHYGQNATLVPATDYVVPANGLGVGYSVVPFVAKATISSSGNSVTFTNASRFTADSTVLTPAIQAGLTFNWMMIPASGDPLPGPSGPYSAIVPWTLPTSTFATHGSRVKLTIGSQTDFAGACQGLTTSTFTTSALNPPDPVIGGGCQNGQMPCTFTVTSQSGVDMVADGWTYSWSVPNLTGGTGSTYSPLFTTSGQYTVSLAATNAFGTTIVNSAPVNVTVQVCLPYRPNIDVFIGFNGQSSGCTSNVGNCSANESILFQVDTFGYNLTCGPHTFDWDFGDGSAHSTSQTPSHSYSSALTYSVTCNVTDTSSHTTQTLSHPLTVAQSAPPPDLCNGGMSARNVFVTFTNNSGSCTNAVGNCTTNETINFTVSTLGYNFGCGSHQFSWDFGDNSSLAGGQSPTHAYAANGTYTVTASVTGPDNPSPIQLTATVRVGGTSGPGSCPTMTNTNVFVSATNSSSSQCLPSGATCFAGQPVTFSAGSLGYNFGCANHTYSWNFGDGSAVGSGSPVTHVFATANTYSVTLTITNSSQSFPALASVVIGGSSGTPVNSVDFSIAPFILNGVQVPNGYLFHPMSDPSGAVTTWSWDFGDGWCPAHGDADCTSTTTDRAHVFSDASNHSVTLTVKVPAGTAATAVHPIKSTPVVIDFSMTPYTINGVQIPNYYLFHPTSDPSGSVTKWGWDFGDGRCPSAGASECSSTGDIPHLFANSNDYTVTLTVQAPSGIAATAVHTTGEPPTSRHRAVGHH